MALLTISNRESLRDRSSEAVIIQEALSDPLELFLSEKIISIDSINEDWPKSGLGFSIETEKGEGVTFLFPDSFGSKKFFQGIVKLALFLQNSESNCIALIKPFFNKGIRPANIKCLEITSLNNNPFKLWITYNSSELTPIKFNIDSSKTLDLDVALTLTLHCQKLDKISEDYTPHKFIISVRSKAVTRFLIGTLNEMGNLIVNEVVMDNVDTSPEIQVQVLLGTISIPLSELIAIRPGSEIEIDWPKSARGVLSFDGKEWTQVEINALPGKISLKIPKEATFLEGMRFSI